MFLVSCFKFLVKWHGGNHGIPLTGFNIPPLVPVALALGCGILAGEKAPGMVAVELFLCVLLSMVAAARVIRKKSPGIFSLVLFFLLGHCLIQFTVSPVFPANHITAFCDKKGVWVQGRVCSVPEFSNQRIRFDLRVERAGSTRLSAGPVAGRLRLSVYSPFPEFLNGLEFNDRVGCSINPQRPRNFNNPGGFDYKRYLGLKGIYARGWAKGVSFVRFPRPAECQTLAFVVNRIQNYRRQFARHIRENVQDSDAAAVLTALVTGDRQGIPRNLKEVFSRTGANHILAISGLHLSIVALISFSLFTRLFSLLPSLVIPGIARKLAAVFTLAPLIFYAVLSGLSPSTQRALIMIVMVMASLAIERQTDTLNALAAAFIIILIVWPGALLSISFQLSFSAVLFILGGMAVVNRIKIKADSKTTESLPGRTVAGIAKFMAVSLFAILGTQPLVMHYFNQISFAGILTNLILIPGAGFMALPLGLSALFIHPFSMYLSGILVAAAGAILSLCVDFLRWVCSFPMVWAHGVTPDLVEISCYYLFFFGVFMALMGMKKRGAFVVIAALLVFSARESLVIFDRFFNKNMNVFVLDVGQGNAALIEAPRGQRVLIDGGGFSTISTFDTGERIVAPFLWSRKILTLDAVVLTHPDSDHMNGLIYILDNFKVGRFVKNPQAGKCDNYQALMAVVEGRRIRVNLVPGLDSIDLGDAHLEFLYPLGEIAENPNNNSVVSKLIHGEISVLFPGDILMDAEEKLVRARSDRLLSTVLIAPHHGSASSSNDFFLDQVRPRSVIVSCGFNNRYGFPNENVLERYMGRGYDVFRTDLAGAVQIISTGSNCEILASKEN